MKRLRDYQKTGERRVMIAEPHRAYTPIGFGEVRETVTKPTQEFEREMARRAIECRWALLGYATTARIRIALAFTQAPAHKQESWTAVY